MKRQGVAFFDFDGTIIKGDSIVPYFRYGFKTGFIPFKSLMKALWAYGLFSLKRISDEEAKGRSLGFLKGKTKKETDQWAEDFFNERLKKRCFKKALGEMEELKKKGVKIIIVSASQDVYMQAVKKGLEVDAVIATRCALDENDVHLGCLGSNNCKGFEKTLRIAEYMASAGMDVDFEASFSYGDSLSDVPMLELTRYPTIVNGKRKTITKTPHMAHVRWK